MRLPKCSDIEAASGPSRVPNKYKCIFIYLSNWYDRGSSNLLPWIARTRLIYVINIMSADDLAALYNNDVIMKAMASQITGVSVYSTVVSDADQRKHQSSASLAFVRWIHRWPVNSPHRRPVTRKMFPFHDVIMDPGHYRASIHWVDDSLVARFRLEAAIMDVMIILLF